MAFDINALEEYNHESWEPLNEYAEQLLDLFFLSPEGQAHREKYKRVGNWSYSLIEMGFIYQEVALSQMDESDVESILLDIFPRKITLRSPDDADEAIPQLISFWTFLQREYDLLLAEGIINYLKKMKPQVFKAEMSNSDKFGIAKSFLSAGIESGFDMSTNEGLQAFQKQYNDNLVSGGNLPFSLPPLQESDEIPRQRIGKKPKAQQKKRKSMAKASRKKNRKKRK